MNVCVVLIQKFFFKNMQIAPNPQWVRRATSLGQFRQFKIQRRGKSIACYAIRPAPDIAEKTGDVGGRLVIFSHPISRKGKFFFSDSERARAYLERGFSALAFDYNGFGESDSIDLFYWRDVVAVIECAKREFPAHQIVLHGTSFGAFHIIPAMEYLPLGAEVVLENVNKSLLSYWSKWPLAGLLVRLMTLFRLKAIREMDILNVVRRFRRPDLHVRFIACEADELTTSREMRELFDELPSANKTFTVFQGAGHLAAPTQDPMLYQSALFSRGCRPC